MCKFVNAIIVGIVGMDVLETRKAQELQERERKCDRNPEIKSLDLNGLSLSECYLILSQLYEDPFSRSAN